MQVTVPDLPQRNQYAVIDSSSMDLGTQVQSVTPQTSELSAAQKKKRGTTRGWEGEAIVPATNATSTASTPVPSVGIAGSAEGKGLLIFIYSPMPDRTFDLA